MPATIIEHPDHLLNMIGHQLGHTDWLSIDQGRINGFADATGDHQWIHVDEEKAAQESPFGCTIAHGFLTLEDDTLFHYLCTELYHPESEGALRWDDPDLGIDWGIEAPSVSEKDAAARAFASFQTPFAP